MKYIITRNNLKYFDAIAKIEYEHWNTIKGGGLQNTNKHKSCLVGILSEVAAGMHLRKKGFNFVEERGMRERLESFNYKADCDLLASNEFRQLKVEVKGITKGSQRGQITKYHAEKYIKNGIDLVIFCEVEYLKDKTAEVDVYLCAKASDIVNWDIEPNTYGKDCYTYEKYLKGESINKIIGDIFEQAKDIE